MARLVVLVVLLGLGCNTVGDDLGRATRLYRDARYEASLRWLVDLEDETGSMTPRQRVRFYYLRGMSAYRLGQREDALHFLALGMHAHAREPEGLTARWREVLPHTFQGLTPLDASPHPRNR